MKSIPSRQFTAEYKNEAVKLVFEQQIPQAQVARQLGISIKLLHNWGTQHRAGLGWAGLGWAGQLKGCQGVDKLTADQLPCLRSSSATGAPASPSFKTASIWLSLNLTPFISRSLSLSLSYSILKWFEFLGSLRGG
jgi:hypothetical protein